MDERRLVLSTPAACGFFHVGTDVVIIEDGLEWSPYKIDHVYEDPDHDYWYDVKSQWERDGEDDKKVFYATVFSLFTTVLSLFYFL